MVKRLVRDTLPQAVAPSDGTTVPAYHGIQQSYRDKVGRNLSYFLLSLTISFGQASEDASGTSSPTRIRNHNGEILLNFPIERGVLATETTRILISIVSS